MKRAIVVALSLCGLWGCASEQVWNRPGASSNDFYVESGQCKAQAYSAPAHYSGQAQRVFDSCMQGKGWRLGKGALNTPVPDGLMRPEYGDSGKK